MEAQSLLVHCSMYNLNILRLVSQKVLTAPKIDWERKKESSFTSNLNIKKNLRPGNETFVNLYQVNKLFYSEPNLQLAVKEKHTHF